MFRASFVSLAIATPAAWADTPLTGAEFQAFTEGKTFSYDVNGMIYGMEEYLPDRRVIWSYIEGQEPVECELGRWFEADHQICFVYGNETATPHCWEFYKDGPRLDGRFMTNVRSDLSYGVEPTTQPLLCLGPEAGV